LNEDDLHGDGRVTETIRNCNASIIIIIIIAIIRYCLIYCACAYTTILLQAVDGKTEAARLSLTHSHIILSQQFLHKTNC